MKLKDIINGGVKLDLNTSELVKALVEYLEADEVQIFFVIQLLLSNLVKDADDINMIIDFINSKRLSSIPMPHFDPAGQ